MKTILVFVSSLDGKVTRWDDTFVRAWSSKADQEYFNRIWNDNRLIVMGSNTYNADPLKHSKMHRLVVMTHNPLDYKTHEVAGQVEFTDESPATLIACLQQEGHE